MASDTDLLIDRSTRLSLDDLDLARFSDDPLDEGSLRCLRYMHDIESHTMCYLRDVLVTRAHADPDLTAFLACWSYEEHWHGDALAKVLAAHGELSGRDRVAAMRVQLPWWDRLRPLPYLIGSMFTDHVVTVHMTWGAVNEWTTQAAYGRLAKKAANPVLADLLRRIMRQEGRHIDFYASQARRRLESSRLAQGVTRRALRRFWEPVGSGVMPAKEVHFLADHLFGDEEGRAVAQRIDRNIDRLPGLAGLHLLERTVAGGAAGG